MISRTALERLAGVETGMISDCMMRLGLSGWMDGIHAVQGGDRRAAGRARTLLFGPRRGEGAWPRSMYATVASLEPGEILVIAAGGTPENLLGDNVATFASQHGLAAIVTDSTVRDVSGMRPLAMPVYAKGAAVRLPVTMEPVALDVPVVCGGAQVRPGDVVVGGEDGVLVLPEQRVDAVLHQLDDVETVEHQLQEAIRSQAPVETIEALIKRKKVARA